MQPKYCSKAGASFFLGAFQSTQGVTSDFHMPSMYGISESI